ncbi:YdbH domain-containing protein [Desulfobacula sp.]|uniref:intermembrane phospholipid transport protein YdbH family protein n=1 Tax=Desulfobacula sp. TaxID=2593537 RepID=UPI00260BCEDD|nr:YdbH domain-containing protein [Desulfobacula sp.]
MRFKRIIPISVWICLGLIIACLFVFINLPQIVALQIKKRLPPVLSANDVGFDIQRLGVSTAFISGIGVGKGIFMDSVRLDYHIKGLSTVHFRQVTVSGLTLHASLDATHGIALQGVTLPPPSKDHTSQTDRSFLPFLPEKIVVQNAKIILHAENEDIFIPFDGVCFIRPKGEKINVQAQWYPFGEKLNTVLTYDMNKGVEFLKVDGKDFDLGHIEPFVSKKIKNLYLKGPVDFNLESASPLQKWTLYISQIGFVQPVEAVVKHVVTTVLIDPRKISAAGTFDISCSVLPATPMAYDMILDLKNDHVIDLTLNSRKIDAYQMATASPLVNITTSQFTAHYNGSAIKGKGEITVRLKAGQVQHPQAQFFFEETTLSSDIGLDFSDDGNGVTANLMLRANKVKITSDSVTSFFPFVGVSGGVSLDKTHTPSGNILVTASNGTVTSTEFKTSASGIQIEVPIQYPSTGKKTYGTYSIPIISYNNQHHFGATGRVLQTDSNTFQVTGGITLKALPDLTAHINATIGFDKGFLATLAVYTKPVKLTDADIEKVIPQIIPTAEIDMTASVKGSATYRRHQLNTSLQVTINDGTLHMPDMDFTAAGINTLVDLNDLLVMESVPGQRLTIDSIDVNKIKITDINVRFSLEDARFLLLENIRFKWCNGLVSSESIRIPQENNAYALTLYCDRLELTQLLKQMGAFNAQGSGTLNGRIPVIYSDGNLSFDNGFLFSTPGSGGKVMIQNTDRITAGIPMNSPQFTQLDLAQEALKDFDYNWAKLVFNTFEDTLSVNMELDGKPSNLLPFAYKKDLGGFVRVDASSPGSRFQGIKLDVNLKLPFNDVMKFGSKLNSILK